jgi:hypothetical protein
MSDSEPEIDVEEGIKQINSQIIKNIFLFLKTGEFNNKTKSAYITAYTIVYKLADDDENNCSKKLYEYYTTSIADYIKEACNELIRCGEDEILDSFIKETEKCKILIHWMRKVFCYLDKYSNKNNKVGTLFNTGLKLYAKHMFTPLKEKLIMAFNKLINAHRDGVSVEPSKIKNMMEIFSQVDLKDPVLNKVGDTGFYWSGVSLDEVLKEWFRSFIRSTEAYVSNKSKKEITCLSAPEYVTSGLKFIKDEDERKQKFIHKQFHDQIDQVITKNMIEMHNRTLARVWF